MNKGTNTLGALYECKDKAKNKEENKRYFLFSKDFNSRKIAKVTSKTDKLISIPVREI